MGSKKEKGAIGLLAVMGVGFLALAGVLVMSEGVLSGLVAGQNTTSAVRAFYASESTVQEGVSHHLNDVHNNNIITSSTFSSALELGDDIDWNNITIEPIEGTFRFVVKGEAKSDQPVRKVSKMMTTYPAGGAFDHALYSAGSATTTIGGNVEIFGDVYSYGSLEIQNASGDGHTINGNVYSSDKIEPFGDNSIDGVLIGDHTAIPAPNIEAENYKEIASSTLTYFTSNTLAQKCIDDGSCDDKVVYIDVVSGVDITINSTSTVSIVTPSDLKVKGGTFVAPKNFPAIVTDGKLSTGGNTKIHGLVVVGGEGESLIANNTEFFGAVIFTNEDADLTGLGTVEIFYDNSSFANIADFNGLGMNSNNITSVTTLNWDEM